MPTSRQPLQPAASLLVLLLAGLMAGCSAIVTFNSDGPAKLPHGLRQIAIAWPPPGGSYLTGDTGMAAGLSPGLKQLDQTLSLAFPAKFPAVLAKYGVEVVPYVEGTPLLLVQRTLSSTYCAEMCDTRIVINGRLMTSREVSSWSFNAHLDANNFNAQVYQELLERMAAAMQRDGVFESGKGQPVAPY